jgi:phosphoribosyl 1,2-cyclic phosphodiesterase
MRMYVTALNSGSNGNCYFLSNGAEAVLIDCGISCRETEKRMKRLGLDIGLVKAIFISHEHADHVRGLRVLSKKYNLPIYLTAATLAQVRINPGDPRIVPMESGAVIRIGGLSVKSFPKLHDAADPHSFVVSYGDLNVGVFTDIGEPCDRVIAHLKQCHALFLETNYDEEMLLSGPYPYYLKRRIAGQSGHLSNRQALDLVLAHGPGHLRHLFLSHISRDNNRPEIIESLFRAHLPGHRIVLTSRDREIPVYEISMD